MASAETKGVQNVVSIDIEKLGEGPRFPIKAIAAVWTEHPEFTFRERDFVLRDRFFVAIATTSVDGKPAEDWWGENKKLQRAVDVLKPTQRKVLTSNGPFAAETIPFWVRNVDTLAELNQDTVEHAQAVYKFSQWLEGIKKKCKTNLVFLSDNSSFDLGELSFALQLAGLPSIKSCPPPLAHYYREDNIYSLIKALVRWPLPKPGFLRKFYSVFALPPLKNNKRHHPLADAEFVSHLFHYFLSASARAAAAATVPTFGRAYVLPE